MLGYIIIAILKFLVGGANAALLKPENIMQQLYQQQLWSNMWLSILVILTLGHSLKKK
jgi:hypothetical protein